MGAINRMMKARASREGSGATTPKILKFGFHLAASGVISERYEGFSTVLKWRCHLKVGAKIQRGAKFHWAHDASCVIASPSAGPCFSS